MKKIWKYAILLVALSALLCMSAFAAEAQLPVFTAEDGVAVEATEMQADKFTLTYTETGLSGECLILMITQEEAAPASEEPQYTINENTIQYVNQDAAEGSVSFNIYPKEMVDAVILMASKDGIQKLGTVKAPAKAGVTVSGTVTSFGAETDPVTVKLLQGETVVKTTTTTDGIYSFNTVSAGDYTLEVSKTKHCTRTYEINVEATAIEKAVVIWLYGDANQNGIVDEKDSVQVLRYAAELSSKYDSYTTENQTYWLAVMDINGDNEVTEKDSVQILRYSSGMTSKFNSIP